MPKPTNILEILYTYSPTFTTFPIKKDVLFGNLHKKAPKTALKPMTKPNFWRFAQTLIDGFGEYFTTYGVS